jgi:5-methylcytosine-specific restriction endonuclease McrA
MMTNTLSALGQLSDHELLAQVHSAAKAERHATVHLIALLVELDSRRLYLGEGYSSLFTYCTQALHLSEHAAYNRIETARAARRFPIVLELIEQSTVTLTSIRLLAPHLTPDNHREVLERARHKNKREVELLVASLQPQPDVASVVRKLPTPNVLTAQTPTMAQAGMAVGIDRPVAAQLVVATPTPRPAEVRPLTPERYKIQITVSRETYDKLRIAQDLLRHSVPNGDPAIIFERALTVLVTQLEQKKSAMSDRPRPSRRVKADSRYVPAAIKRTVWQRDAGQCAFQGTNGRCAETGFLEYHHVVPFAAGGETSAENLELRCRAHNQHEAAQYFGRSQMSFVREDRVSYGI